VRKIVVHELLALDGVAEDPDEFINEWDGAKVFVAGAIGVLGRALVPATRGAGSRGGRDDQEPVEAGPGAQPGIARS
jgi:hypothetical protein